LHKSVSIGFVINRFEKGQPGFTRFKFGFRKCNRFQTLTATLSYHDILVKGRVINENETAEDLISKQYNHDQDVWDLICKGIEAIPLLGITKYKVAHEYDLKLNTMMIYQTHQKEYCLRLVLQSADNPSSAIRIC
jgi:hypothetical protein